MSITPFLWFDGKAEEAANFYVSVFRNSKLVSVNRAGPGGPVITATFQLDGQTFMALNGGPMYTFSPAVSFMVSCDSQAEVDDLWGKLSAGGEEQPCGWVKDRYGLSWQVIPSILGKLCGGPDPKKAGQAVQAMLRMKKIDIAELQRAYDQG